MSPKLVLLSAASALPVLWASVAWAEDAAPPAGQVSELVVTAQRLNDARSSIEPALGASTYTMPKEFIQSLPGGTNTQLNQVVLQAPGVAQDSFGQLHV